MSLCNQWTGIIERLGSSFGSVFLVFPKKVARGHTLKTVKP